MLRAVLIWASAAVVFAVAACGDTPSTDDSTARADDSDRDQARAHVHAFSSAHPDARAAGARAARDSTRVPDRHDRYPEPDESSDAPEVGDEAPNFKLASASGSDMIARFLPGRQERGAGLLQGLLVNRPAVGSSAS